MTMKTVKAKNLRPGDTFMTDPPITVTDVAKNRAGYIEVACVNGDTIPVAPNVLLVVDR
jgi:hypothetical protein